MSRNLYTQYNQDTLRQNLLTQLRNLPNPPLITSCSHACDRFAAKAIINERAKLENSLRRLR